MSDSTRVDALPIDALPGRSWPENFFLRAIRLVPGLGTTAPDRLLTAWRGSLWTIVGYGSSQLLRMASMIILARHLLGPEAFGLVALVNVFIGGLSMLSDLGIGTDVIQHPRGDDPDFVSTAFLVAAARGVLLWLIASALAYPFALFYHQPAIFAMALVSATSVLLSSLVSGSYYSMTRHVQLGQITMLRLAAEAVGLVVSVAWAMASPTAWSLVVGRVTVEAFFTIGTHLIGERRMSLRWDRSAAKDILAFGVGMFVSSATYFLSGESERLVVGKLVDLISFGCFSLALSITAAVTGGPQRLIAQVFYPMLAKSVRGDRSLAASQYRKMRVLLLMACSGISVACVVGGKWIVSIMLGPKFAMTGWILQLLGFRAALELFMMPTAQLLFAFGAARWAGAGGMSKFAFLAAGLAVAFEKFGFREAVWVLALAPLFGEIPFLFWLRRNFSVVFWNEIATLGALVAVSAIALILTGVG